MKHIIIVDIDGTIQRIGDRKDHLKVIPPEYDAFHNKFMEDEPIEHVCRMINALSISHEIVFVTQRPMRLFNHTGYWIRDNTALTTFNLFMRADNDYRDPWIVKPELITTNMDIDDILFAIDDSDKVIKTYCKLGIECIKVVDLDQGSDSNKQKVL